MIIKNSNIIIFQSPFQTKLFMQYNIDIFVDGIFKFSPKCGYQVFITRTYVNELNSFYTTSFSILKNKEQRNYLIFIYLFIYICLFSKKFFMALNCIIK